MGTTIQEVIWQACWLCVVAILWGCTNPLIKIGGKGVETIKRDGAIRQFLAELHFLLFNWRYMVPFLMNQSGAVIYYITLASADISLAVPITNSLTFIFTSLTGKLMGEPLGNKETLAGMALVMAGISVCVVAKLET